MWVRIVRVYRDGRGVVLVGMVRFVGGSVNAGLVGGRWLGRLGRVVLCALCCGVVMCAFWFCVLRGFAIGFSMSIRILCVLWLYVIGCHMAPPMCILQIGVVFYLWFLCLGRSGRVAAVRAGFFAVWTSGLQLCPRRAAAGRPPSPLATRSRRLPSRPVSSSAFGTVFSTSGDLLCVFSTGGEAGRVLCGYVGVLCGAVQYSVVDAVVCSVCWAEYGRNGRGGEGCKCCVPVRYCRLLSGVTCFLLMRVDLCERVLCPVYF